jgi:hypothetical protein
MATFCFVDILNIITYILLYVCTWQDSAVYLYQDKVEQIPNWMKMSRPRGHWTVYLKKKKERHIKLI